MIKRHYIATENLIAQWLPEMEQSQKRFAMRIFKAQEVTLPFSTETHRDRVDLRRMCRVVLDCIEDIPREFFDRTFASPTDDKVKTMLRSVKTAAHRLLESLEIEDSDRKKEGKFFSIICAKIDLVVEKLLFSSYGVNEER